MYRVFLIDDEAWALISLERLISWEELGFTVSGKADNAREAWERICLEHPDVVITDIRMPGMSGLELLERLRLNDMDVSVILVSGFAEFRYAQEAVHHGAFEYLLKQVSREQLTDCMKRLYRVLSEKEAGSGEGHKPLWRALQDQDSRQATELLLEKQGRQPVEFAKYAVGICRDDGEASGNLSFSEEGLMVFPLGIDGEQRLFLFASDREDFASNGLLQESAASDSSERYPARSWGFSREGGQDARISDLVREARAALNAACFIGRAEMVYHPKENRWKGWDSLARSIRYRQNILVREQLLSLKEAVKNGDVLLEELFFLCEKMDYEYRQANGQSPLMPEKWNRESDLIGTFPEEEEFFSWLLGCFPAEEENSVTERINCRLEENLRDAPTLAALGKELGMSQSALSQILKRSTGKTYSELLREKRMEKARELLIFTEKSIVEIADETGFADQFYFSKTFRKTNGISPNQYRKKHKK